MSPILWLDHEIDEMLFGSPVLQEAKNRREALKDEWSNLDQIIDSNPTIFTPSKSFNTSIRITCCIKETCLLSKRFWMRFQLF